MVHRLIRLEGCFNFRDVGGYPTAGGRRVRWRRVFRSDGLHALTAADVRALREEVALAQVIDLRSPSELRSEGRGLLGEEPVEFHHVPLFDGDAAAATPRPAEPEGPPAAMTLADRYVLLADFAADRIARVLATLAAAPGPAVFHCAAGKDRTGVVSAILLGLLGVPDEVIVADYVATRESLDAIVDRLMSLEGYRAMLAALPPDTLHANPETMVVLLGHLRARWGSLADYARAAGLDDAVRTRLIDRLLE
jgi:protein-tyrosine phosphatase